MKNNYLLKLSLLLWIGLFFGIPGTAQKNLVLNMQTDVPSLRGSKIKFVSKIEYVSERFEHSATISYDRFGKVQRLTVKGGIGGIDWNADLYYERTESKLNVYKLSGNTKTLVRICQLNSMGYVTYEQDPDGSHPYKYTYNEQGETQTGLFEGNPVNYVWENGNLSQYIGTYFHAYEHYTEHPNWVNLYINSIYREPYWEDRYGLALCGYIGNNDANLVYKADDGKAIIDYDLDIDGYPTQLNVLFDGEPETILLEYDETIVPEPVPEPDPDDPTIDDLGKIIDEAPQGTEDDPTEIFIPGSGITIHKPVDIDGYKHLRITGGPLFRGEDNPYAMIRIRPGSSLELKNIQIDGKNVDLKDGSLIVNGVLRIKEGAIIRNCNRSTPDTPSGAICIGPEGMLVMEGGCISDNIGSYGSAVYNEGTFLLKGGTIQGNKAQIGSIVNNEQGKFVMTGGEVKDNFVKEGCGGIFNSEYTSFSMTGGVISRNEDCDLYTWTNLQIGGSAKVDGLTLLNTGNKLLIRPSLQNNWRIAYVDRPEAGTVVAKGYGDYQLTAADFRKISYDKQACILEQTSNAIVITGITANEDVIKDAITWEVKGEQLLLNGLKPLQPYAIYTVSGRLILQQLSDVTGHGFISLPNGIYFVSQGDQSIKINVVK